MSQPKAVMDAWHKYQFPERSIQNNKGDRVGVKDPVLGFDAEVFIPTKLDANEEGEMKKIVNIVGEMLSESEHWFHFSPLEVYLEKVFAERLKTLEPRDL